MKINQNTSKQPLACLSALNANDNVAILGAEIKTNEQGLVQLLPYGKFKAVDGRPKDTANNHWLMDELAFEQLKANAPHKVNDIVIDYEHQALKAEKTGEKAIASGFFNIDDVQLIKGQGLFIKPRWTKTAQAHLDAGEYKYISAVFAYDLTTGRPKYLHSAGLVNRPGVDGMQPLADLAAKEISNLSIFNKPQHKETAVNPLLLAILQALGIKGDLPTEAAALKAFETQTLAALSAIQSKADQVEGLNTQLAALSAEDATKVPVESMLELQQQMADLQAKVNGGEVDNLVSLGMQEGKILASLETWARELGNKNIADLKAFLDKAPAMTALKSKQTEENNNLDNNDDPNLAALSAEDKEAATLLGMTHDEFAKQKTADINANNSGAK